MRVQTHRVIAGAIAGFVSVGIAAPSAMSQSQVRTGNQPRAQFGFSLADAGVVTQDSIIDVLVGAHRGSGGAAKSGRAYVHRGGTLGQSLAFNGANAGDGFGRALAGINDVNGDDRADIVIAAPLHDQARGRIYAYSGKNKSLLWSRKGEALGDRFGTALANAGDIDGDGADDLAVGAPGHNSAVVGPDAGRVYVVSGANGDVLWSVGGDAGNDLLGTAVTGIGDLDDDGVPDIVAGAIRNDTNGVNAGRVYVFSGANTSILQELDAEFPGVQFGTALDAGQFTHNGDQHSVLITGIPRDNQGGAQAGHIHIYVRNHAQPFCGDNLLCQIHIANGAAPGDHLGRSVAVGQIWGNEIPEFLAGAPRNDEFGANAGAVYVYSLDDIPQFCCTDIEPAATFFGEAPGDQFGYAVAMIDMDGDGVNEAVVGAPRNDAGGVDAGRVYVFDLD